MLQAPPYNKWVMSQEHHDAITILLKMPKRAHLDCKKAKKEKGGHFVFYFN